VREIECGNELIRSSLDPVPQSERTGVMKSAIQAAYYGMITTLAGTAKVKINSSCPIRVSQFGSGLRLFRQGGNIQQVVTVVAQADQSRT
jgi:hypothetical protein